MSHSLTDALYFLSRFIKKPHSVGSIWPSSRQLGQVMLEGIPLKKGDVIIEYGPGTGPFTQLIQPYLKEGLYYLGIEYDLHLFQGLQRRFPEMQFHHGSAEETPELLKYYGLHAARLIVSGLPFANMPASLQANILEATQKSLLPDGYFRTFTYFFSGISKQAQHFRKNVKEHFFYEHSCKKVMLNFPPARVLSYSHPK